MLGSERRNIILDLINSEGSVSIDALVDQFKVSRMTIWRDLKALEDEKKIMKVHGGAIKIESGSGSRYQEEKKDPYVNIKQQLIARYAAETKISNDKIIFLDSSNTVLEMVPHMKQSNLTLLTNGLNILNQASQYLPHFNLLSSGGILQENTSSFVGDEAERFFDNFKGDIFFFSAMGISIEDGITDISPLDIRMKKKMGDRVKIKIGLFDSNKIGKVSLSKLWDIQDVDLLILDEETDPQFLDSLIKRKVLYEIASKSWLKDILKKKRQ